MHGQEKDKAQTYMNLQKLHLRLLCQHYPSKVLDRIRRIKKNEIHFSLDDCLEICREFNQVEACAIFTNKMGNYFSSVTYYMNLVTSKKFFNFPKMFRQLFQISSRGDQIPHFIPYMDKKEK